MPSIESRRIFLCKVDLHIYFTERRNRVVASEKRFYIVFYGLSNGSKDIFLLIVQVSEFELL